MVTLSAPCHSSQHKLQQQNNSNRHLGSRQVELDVVIRPTSAFTLIPTPDITSPDTRGAFHHRRSPAENTALLPSQESTLLPPLVTVFPLMNSLQSSRNPSFDSLSESAVKGSPPRARAMRSTSFNPDISAILTPPAERTSDFITSPVPVSSLPGKRDSSGHCNPGTKLYSTRDMSSYWSPWNSTMDQSKRHGLTNSPSSCNENTINTVSFHSLPSVNVLPGCTSSHDTAHSYQDASLGATLHASEEYQNIMYSQDVNMSNASDVSSASSWHQFLGHHDTTSAAMISMNASTATVIPTQTMMIPDMIDGTICSDTTSFDNANLGDDRGDFADWDIDFSDRSPSSGYSICGFFDSPQSFRHLPYRSHSAHERLSVRMKKHLRRPSSSRIISTSSLLSKRPQHYRNTVSTSITLPPSSSPTSTTDSASFGVLHHHHRASTGGSSSAYPGIHPPNKHLCSTCGRKFQRKEHLRRHEMTHDENAPSYPCPDPMCTKEFKARNDNLREHFKTHLRQTPSSRTKHPRTFEEFYGFLRERYPRDEAEKNISRLEAWREDGGHLKSENASATSVAAAIAVKRSGGGGIWRH